MAASSQILPLRAVPQLHTFFPGLGESRRHERRHSSIGVVDAEEIAMDNAGEDRHCAGIVLVPALIEWRCMRVAVRRRRNMSTY
jgi:hypothetical protein